MQADNFTTIEFTASNLDRYCIRKAILDAIQLSKSNFSGKLLDIGCGKMPYKNLLLLQSRVDEYIGLDIEQALEYDAAVWPDFTWDGITMPFDSGLFDTAFATEVLEHCPEPVKVMQETYRVMKSGACFFFTVPFLWNLHEVPHDEYRYTPFSLERILTQAGFKNIEIKAQGGWHASMAQMLGLWVRRAPLGNATRKILSYVLKPMIAYLAKKDKEFPVEFKEGQMITGLYGIAYK